jgi:hypothetical protein
MQRYYSYYANRTRGERRKVAEAAAASSADEGVPTGAPKLLEGCVAIIEAENFSRADARRRSAELIRLVYEVAPMVCPHSGGQMRAIALIREPKAIDKILRHLRAKGRDARAGPWATGPPTGAAIDRVVHHSTIIEFGKEMGSVRAEEAGRRQRVEKRPGDANFSLSPVLAPN